MKTHNSSFHKCVCYVFVIFVNFFSSELHQGGESNCSECYKQFKKKNNLTKHLESFIKGDLGDGKDLWHATFVNYDGEQLINESPLHLVD